MAKAGYQQYCGLARTLDVVGDRWTLLIVRELVAGPRRFSDLLDGLPGVSRPLLTERLRHLEAEGLVARRQLPPPAARQVYELTEEGRDLSAAMVPMIAWGAKRLGDRPRSESFHPRWAAVGMLALADRDAARGVRETYQYVVDDYAFFFVVDDGAIEIHDGRAEEPAVTVETDAKTWAAIAGGKIDESTARSRGTLTVTGDREATRRLRKIFSRSTLLSHADHVIGRAVTAA